MFGNFDNRLLEDPEFKEDAVREVIITPILTRLGYGPSGTYRITRSKTLIHPFIFAGTRKLAVKLIPDYTLFCDDKPLLILDAKAPTVDIERRDHIQQVYSYAIHPEIRCQHFALCNGRHLTVFDVNHDAPILSLPFSQFEEQWHTIERCLQPKFLKKPALRKFAPDFGQALHRMGFVEGGKLTFLPAKLNLFAQLDREHLTASANMNFCDTDHCVSFDFHRSLLPDIVAGTPKPLATYFCDALERAPFMAAAELTIVVDIETILGPEIASDAENYRPLIIQKVLKATFDPAPLPKRPTDIPAHVFRIRDAYQLASKTEN